MELVLLNYRGFAQSMGRDDPLRVAKENGVAAVDLKLETGNGQTDRVKTDYRLIGACAFKNSVVMDEKKDQFCKNGTST